MQRKGKRERLLLENKKPIENGRGAPWKCLRHALVRRCFVDGNCYLCSHLPPPFYLPISWCMFVCLFVDVKKIKFCVVECSDKKYRTIYMMNHHMNTSQHEWNTVLHRWRIACDFNLTFSSFYFHPRQLAKNFFSFSTKITPKMFLLVRYPSLVCMLWNLPSFSPQRLIILKLYWFCVLLVFWVNCPMTWTRKVGK